MTDAFEQVDITTEEGRQAWCDRIKRDTGKQLEFMDDGAGGWALFCDGLPAQHETIDLNQDIIDILEEQGVTDAEFLPIMIRAMNLWAKNNTMTPVEAVIKCIHLHRLNI